MMKFWKSSVQHGDCTEHRIIFLKVVKSINLTSYPPTPKMEIMGGDGCDTMTTIILQYVRVSNHHIVHLTCITCQYYLSKAGKKIVGSYSRVFLRGATQSILCVVVGGTKVTVNNGKSGAIFWRGEGDGP